MMTEERKNEYLTLLEGRDVLSRTVHVHGKGRCGIMYCIVTCGAHDKNQLRPNPTDTMSTRITGTSTPRACCRCNRNGRCSGCACHKGGRECINCCLKKLGRCLNAFSNSPPI